MVPPLLLLALLACGARKIAEECDASVCPVGTAPAESRALEGAIDLDLAFDPTTYAGEVAFKEISNGSCSVLCATIEPCDEGTFPVITEDCFTCGVVDETTGEVNQGSCSEL